jgi:hypothetical protein
MNFREMVMGGTYTTYNKARTHYSFKLVTSAARCGDKHNLAFPQRQEKRYKRGRWREPMEWYYSSFYTVPPSGGELHHNDPCFEPVAFLAMESFH